METKKIGNLKCDYAAAEGSRVCYFISPLPIGGKAIEEWAARYGQNIVVITGVDWDNDLTPWTAKGVEKGDADFRGEAALLLERLRGEVMPGMERTLNMAHPIERTLAGVSLSGLFAVWAWTQGDDFDNIASISGSFWYDSFTGWLSRQDLTNKTGCAYFSLGNKEGKAGNPRFNTVQEDTQRVVEIMQNNGIKAMFEPTDGTHFAPMNPRIEKMFVGLEALGNHHLKTKK